MKGVLLCNRFINLKVLYTVSRSSQIFIRILYRFSVFITTTNALMMVEYSFIYHYYYYYYHYYYY